MYLFEGVKYSNSTNVVVKQKWSYCSNMLCLLSKYSIAFVYKTKVIYFGQIYFHFLKPY
jgi:hypothetical protein